MNKYVLLSLSCVIALSTVTVASATPDKAATPATAPAADKAAQPAAVPLAGKVLETMDSGGYTYVYLEKKGGEKVWVATAATPVKVGSQMTFKGGAEMFNFESKSLKRTFDKIVFADAAVSDTPIKDGTSYKGKSTSGGSKAAAATKDGKISVAKASGANAYTVQEIFTNSAKLNKKKVVVKGKVVKVSAGIMGRNWIHIQDGTGSQTKKTHNLVCTSKDSAEVDDVVTISGILAKDKDFGGGYKYDAIVEESTVRK
ncbi:MAG TPA: DNA-binding protein [Desulfuromonadales bacterium]|nr:DNA-binding protein [Desulfuromonadales bacterium]